LLLRPFEIPVIRSLDYDRAAGRRPGTLHVANDTTAFLSNRAVTAAFIGFGVKSLITAKLNGGKKAKYRMKHWCPETKAKD